MARKPHTLVVGGTRGLGCATARLLAKSGHRVSVLSRSEVTPDKRIRGVYYCAQPGMRSAHAGTAIEQIVTKNGRLTNLVFFQRWRGKSQEDDGWDNELATSLTWTKNLIEAAAPEMATAGGSIVLVSSVVSRLIWKQTPVSYHVAKAGMNQMARYYAVTLGSRKIRVNSVSPGTILKEETQDTFLKNPKMMALYEKAVPLGRLPTAEELARLVRFLCDDAACITGQNIVMDGGLSLVSQEGLARELLGID